MDKASAEKRKALLAQLRHVARAGEVIFREGEESSELYILLAGSLEIKRGDKTIAVVSEKDTYLGEMSTLLGTPRTATLVAREDCVLVRVPEEKVADFFNHSPALALKLSRILAHRLNEMNKKHRKTMESSGTPDYESGEIYERLVCTQARKKMMATYAKKIGETLTIEDLAKTLAVSPTELDRIMTDFEAAKLIKADGKSAEMLPCPNEKLERGIRAFAAGENS